MRVPVAISVVACCVLVYCGSALAGPTPACNDHAQVALDVSAAAGVATGAHSTFGASAAAQLASQFRTGGGDICKFDAGAAVQAKLRTIAALYRTNRSAAHVQLLSLLAEIHAGTIHARRATVRTLAGPCPDLKAKISVGNASQVIDDVAAQQAAQNAGETAGATQANTDAGTALDQFATTSGASTVGDWIAIAAAAQALGADSVADSAIAHAQKAASPALKAATPSDPCDQSDPCYTQAQAVALMVGAADNVPCSGELWTFEGSYSGTSGGDAFGTITFDTGRFRLNTETGAISDASSAPGSLGETHGTWNCKMNGATVESGTVPKTPFHYSISGEKHGTVLLLTPKSSDYTLQINASVPFCKGGAELGITIIKGLIKAGLPFEFKLTPNAQSATAVSIAGGQVTGKITRVG